jgi:hypothetical protein
MSFIAQRVRSKREAETIRRLATINQEELREEMERKAQMEKRRE